MRYVTFSLTAGLLALTLSACDEKKPGGISNGGVTPSDDVKKEIAKNGAESALLLGKDGQLVVITARGKPLQRCQYPGGTDKEAPPCKSLQKGANIVLVNHFTVIRSKINPWCDVWISSGGYAFEDCDPHQ